MATLLHTLPHLPISSPASPSPFQPPTASDSLVLDPITISGLYTAPLDLVEVRIEEAAAELSEPARDSLFAR